MNQKVDILAIGAHPDDVELGCGGALAKFKAEGKSTAILDLTQGELGTRGSAELRKQEADKAAEVLGVSYRVQANLRDGFIRNDEESQLKLISFIRLFKPDVLLINAPNDRHPDHPHAAALAKDAAFKAGLRRIVTHYNGEEQEPHRPRLVFHYLQFWNIQPDIIMDISGFLEQKLESVRAYASQFYQPESTEPTTAISSQNFWDSISYRAKDMGRLIYRDAGEGFISAQPLGCDQLTDLL